MTDPALTVSAVPDETLNAILAGCEGVTPGPWLNINSIDKNEVLRCEVRQIDTDPTNEHHWPFRVCSTVPGQFANADKANLDHLARLDPATVRAIVTELLALRSTRSPSVKALEANEMEAVARELCILANMAEIPNGDSPRATMKIGAKLIRAAIRSLSEAGK